MPRFRSKSAEIIADQFLVYCTPYPPGVEERTLSGDPATIEGALVEFFVRNAHGHECEVEHEDWIIKEPVGPGYYPCKPDVFEKRWEWSED